MDIIANWIWRKQTNPCYNDTVIAKKEFEISRNIQKAVISITADSYYRLFINDQWICDGPARGWPEHYYYEKIDITDFLHNGLNQVKVIACYYGTGHFHGIPQQAGLLAQMNIHYTDYSVKRIVTDQNWQITRACGWHANTPKISVQMSPGEYYDARNENSLNYEPAAIICKAHEGPWKDIKPRDVKMLTQKRTQFAAFMGANVLKKYNTSHNYCIPWAKLLYPGLIQANRYLMPAFALTTIVQTNAPIKFSINLTDYRKGIYNKYINGEEIKTETSLSAGRHLLFISHGLNLNHTTDITFSVLADGVFELINPYKPESDNPWAMLEFKESKAFDYDIAWKQCPEGFQDCMKQYRQKTKKLSNITDISQFVSKTLDEAMDLTFDDMFAKDSYHRFITRREVDGEIPAIKCPEGILSGHNSKVLVLPSNKGDVELVYDLGVQNIGYYSFEIETQEDVEIDIYGVEYITPNGKIQFPEDHRNGMTYITKSGTNKFTSLKRRSGRYLFIRFSGQSKPITIKNFTLIESTYPVQYKGSFKCSDESLNRIWDISAYTLKLCMEDTFTDCPLYEQTLWVGDARNESLFAYGVFGSTDTAKRCIILAAQSLERFPIIGSQVPSSWYCILPAWSFLWGISVWDYYWYTKDEKFLTEIWPNIFKNLKGAYNYINSNGLFSADFWNLFDWAGIDQNHETVLHNTMFMVGAFKAAIKCAQVLGKEAELEWLKIISSKLKKSINRVWQDAEKSYPDSIHEDGTISDSISQHTSFLSLLYDIAGPDKTPHLMQNILNPPKLMVKVGSPFAISYMYEMLDNYGQYDFILKSIYDSYLPMLKAGATTVWESFACGTLGDDNFPTRSHCHAWSSAPVYFLNRIILGIRQTSPGGDSFVISPYVKDLDWAKGSLETPQGSLEVHWRKANDKIELSYSAPQRIRIIFKENHSHQGYKFIISRIV